MLLIEIRDPSDYQRGDENNPRSPHFEDEPDWDSMADDHMPGLPVLDVQAKPGKSPRGEPYNLVLTITVPGDKESASIEEYAWSEFDKATDGQWEYVDDSHVNNGKQGYVTTIFGMVTAPNVNIGSWPKIYADIARQLGVKHGAESARKYHMSRNEP